MTPLNGNDMEKTVPNEQDPHFIEIASGRWRVWRGAVLRGAGFPVHLVARLGDAHLAQMADKVVDEAAGSVLRPVSPIVRDFASVYEQSALAAARRLAQTARSERFREAITWQNLPLIDSLLDRFDPEARGTARQRKRETVIASYLQRYTTKNESIGFFGPVSWARWSEGKTHLDVGSGFLRRRSVYFENWAIDALRESIAARPSVRRQIAPRRNPSHYLDVAEGRVVRGLGRPVLLTLEQLELLLAIDGSKTVDEITAQLGKDATAVDEMLRGLEKADVVRVDLGGPLEAFPEKTLARQLAHIAGPSGDEVRGMLTRLVTARDEVARAAGDAELLRQALGALNATFVEITGRPASRMHGKTYAGRTLVYEDCQRSTEAVLSQRVLADLEAPLSLVLDSGRWLTARLAQAYERRFDELWDRATSRTGASEVPLHTLLALASRDFYTGDGLPQIARDAAAELTDRWAGILRVGKSRTPVQRDPEDLRDAVRTEFASLAPGWTSARHHSPDVMIAAADIDAVERGDYLLVLGELHLAFNTVESRALVEQHDDPVDLLRMSEAAIGGPRFVPAAPREWGSTTSRTSPPSALISEDNVYWSVGPDDDSHLPGGSLPVAALVVCRQDGVLTVKHRSGRVLAPLVDFLGEYLSGVAVNCFALLPRARHTPRVTIGRLVVARESWRITTRECDWVNNMDEHVRYLYMRAWKRRHGLPDRAFYKVPTETKPSFVDFASPALVNVLATHVRQLAPDDSVSLSEMLPDLNEAWLADDTGSRYTAELRMVVAEGTAS